MISGRVGTEMSGRMYEGRVCYRGPDITTKRKSFSESTKEVGGNNKGKVCASKLLKNIYTTISKGNANFGKYIISSLLCMSYTLFDLFFYLG